MKVGIVYEFLSGQGSLEILEGIEVMSPDRTLLQYPWGMHMCDDQQKKHTSRETGFKTWCAFGIPRNNFDLIMTFS